MEPETITIDGSAYTIRCYNSADSLLHLTEMLHRAYAGLAAMGLRFLATHQDDDVTRNRLNGEWSFVVEKEGTIVATVTVYQPRPHDECAWYNTPGVWCFGQFGVEPALQRQGIGKLLMSFIEQRVLEAGGRELACDTAEPALHLRSWYESMGYGFKQFVQWQEVNYRSVILSKTLGSNPDTTLSA